MVSTDEHEDACVHDSLCELNAKALKRYKANEPAEAVAAYSTLFTKVKTQNLTHAEIYTCYNNCAAALMQIGQFEKALQHAEHARKLAEEALHRTPKAFQPYVKAIARKANALIELGLYREASLTAEEGLKLDPFNLALKQTSEKATQGILRDLLEGKGKETLALPNAEPTQRITYHPHSAPLHKIKTDNMLPTQLLTPFQAESDHHVRDTYNYVTVMTDIAMPKRHLAVLQDRVRQEAWRAAIAAAVAATIAEDKDCRVLDLGAGAGLHTMLALDAGAYHVTAVERWLYLSLACKQTLQANGFSNDAYNVIYKRPTDLALQHDVPNFCNLLLCDLLDEGLLASGIIPAVRQCLDKLLTTDARIIPASATVFCQAAQVCTSEVCGLDMSGIDRHRWHTSHTAGAPLAEGMFDALSDAVEVWHFDMLAPPEESGRKSLDLTFTRDGKWNAVVFWYELHLTQDITLCTGPAGIGSGMTTLRPAVQYLAGEMSVEAGNVLPLLATHNTVRMRFDVEEAEYLHLAKPDAAFPAMHFSMLADSKRNEAYNAAIARVIKQKKVTAGSAHVIDMGTGAGLFALMAARAGADSVIACDLHQALCSVATKNAAANGLSEKISVVHRDAGLLERGKHVRRLGANIVVADMFDAGLLGNGFMYLLDQAKRNVLQPGSAVVPCGATLYVMGIHVPPAATAGYDMSAMDQYRWDKEYESCQLDQLPHTCLTKPCKALDFFFEGDSKGRGRDNIVKLEVVAEGLMNAVAFWFDLHLDAEVSLCSGPSYVQLGGAFVEDTTQPAVASAVPHGADQITAPAHTASSAATHELAHCIPPASEAQEQPSNVGDGAKHGETRAVIAADMYAARSNAVQTTSCATAESVTQHTACKAGSSGPLKLENICQDDKASPGPSVTSAAGSGIISLAAVDASAADSNAAATAMPPHSHTAFEPAGVFCGAKDGFVFKLGDHGLGYYTDPTQSAMHAEHALPAEAAMSSELAKAPSLSTTHQKDLASPVKCNDRDCDMPQNVHKSLSGASSTINVSGDSRPDCEVAAAALLGENNITQVEGSHEQHYWGQALQYLDSAVQVHAGKKGLLLAKREGSQVRFSLRAGAGSPVAKAPWKVQWGGGASVENPHYQRVHYCDLLVQDFLQRVGSGRFPSIEKDMQMVQAHCGSLFLDPAQLAKIYHELVVLEQMHVMHECGPGASLQALTAMPLQLH